VVVRAWESWAAQRNAALAHVRTPWVFFVDVDERVPLELAEEIGATVSRATEVGQPVGFWVPRQNLIMGRWVRHAGWHPDYQLRLFRVDRGRYASDRAVHELVQLDGSDARLTARLVHHNYEAWGQFWRKQLRYARAEATQLHAAGQRARPRNLVLQPLRELRRRFVTLGGYREGLLGLALSVVLAGADLVKYAELLRLGRAARR
ncbi:MAG TPA: glycosyltransferase family 2 protein, partial [Chloroflexota bacterium]|nr:glycosyltransferase family 2 protein [Chloroflexota bacterium]